MCIRDRYDIGIQDGAEGYSPSRLAQHQEACAEFRVRPDRGAYQAGWDRGIGEYCTPDRGFQEGRRGASYAYVCPPPLEWAFLEGYRNGQQLYRQEQRLREVCLLYTSWRRGAPWCWMQPTKCC